MLWHDPHQRQRTLQLTATAAALLMLALPGPGWLKALAGLAVLVLAAYEPAPAVAMAPLTFPFTFVPIAVGGLQFIPAEVTIGLLAAAAGLHTLWRGVTTRRWPTIDRPPAWSWLPALALLIVGVGSLWFVADPSHLRESVRELRTTILLPLVYAALAWTYLRHSSWLLLTLASLGAASLFVALVGLTEQALGVAGVLAGGVRRATSVYDHPNNAALFIGRGAAVWLGFLVTDAFRHERWLVFAAGATTILGLIATFSRGGWLALLVTALVLAVLVRRWREAVLVTATGAMLIVVLMLAGVERFTSLLDLTAGSSALRLDVWRSTLAMLADHPLTGVGLDQFLYQYQTRYVAPAAWDERFTAHPHNVFLDFWVRLGILGLVVGLALFGAGLRAALRLHRHPVGQVRSAAIAAGGVVVYSLVHGLVDNGYFLPDLALSLWAALVVLARSAWLAARTRGGTAVASGERSPARAVAAQPD